MTDKEIIKALECCFKNNCGECCLAEAHPFGINECTTQLAESALNLIKHQQEYIEEIEVIVGLQRKRKYYNRFVKEVWQKDHGEMSYPDADEIYRLYFEQRERMDRIVEQLEELRIPRSKISTTMDIGENFGLNRAIEIVKGE